ncbi:MAG: DUF1573 domain-containing protein [Planctomycetota bacterium]
MSKTALMRFLRPAVVISACLLLCSCDGGEQPAAPVSEPPGGGEEGAAGAPPPSVPDAAPVTSTFVWPDPPPYLPEGAPLITFAKTRHAYGAITDAGTYKGSFEFRNTGKGKLIISDIKTSCGCTVPKLDKREFLPGEGSTLDIVFDPTNMKGGTIKDVSVVSNAYQHPYTKLSISADITPLVTWNSLFLRLETLELGKEHRRTFSGLCTDPNLRITGFTSDNPHLAVDMRSVSAVPAQDEGPQEYRVLMRLTVADTAPWGRIDPGKLTVTVRGGLQPGDEPREAKYDFLIFGDLYGDLRVDPFALSAGNTLRLGEPFAASIVLSSASGTYFAVIDASVVDPTDLDLDVQVEPLDPASYRISIHGTASARGALKGRGRVRVRTDVPGEDDLTILIFGYVK